MKHLNSEATKVFKAIIALLGDQDHIKIDNSGGTFIPVTVERLYKTPAATVYSVTHWVEYNSDLCRDCDMTFAVTEEGTAPLEYQADFTGTYQEVALLSNGRVEVQDERQYNELVAFCELWMNNINEQQCLGV